MALRMRRSDIEGNFRRAWLLTALLEDYFRLRGMWYQVGTIDASAFSVVAALLMTSALFACYVPARRAMKVDPMRALREE